MFHRVHWTGLGLMPWRCWCPTHSSSTSICLMDHGGLDRRTCLLPTMPWPCWCSAHSPLPPDGSWRSGSWSMPTTNYSYSLSYSLNVFTLICPSVHMASIAPVHLGEGSASVALLKVPSLFSLWRVVWEFFLIRCEVLGQGCLFVQIVKHSEANL